MLTPSLLLLAMFLHPHQAAGGTDTDGHSNKGLCTIPIASLVSLLSKRMFGGVAKT